MATLGFGDSRKATNRSGWAISKTGFAAFPLLNWNRDWRWQPAMTMEIFISLKSAKFPKCAPCQPTPDSSARSHPGGLTVTGRSFRGDPIKLYVSGKAPTEINSLLFPVEVGGSIRYNMFIHA